MADPAEVGVVWRAETRRAATSTRGIALVVLFLFAETLTLGVGGCINVGANKKFDEFVAEKGLPPEAVRAEMVKQKREALKAITRNSEQTVDVIAEVPLVLLLVFFATTLFAPLLIALMGFDQISAEVGPKSIRFLVIRAQRDSVLIGKFLSQITVLALLMLISVVGMVGVSKAINSDFTWPLAVEWTLKLWLAAMVIGCAYAALTAMCSALVRLPALGLFLNIIALFVFWFVGLLSNAWAMPGTGSASLLKLEESPLAYIRYLVPSQYESLLLSPAPLEFGAGVFALVGYALVFLALARMALDWRDV